jgi:hypothetical protein
MTRESIAGTALASSLFLICLFVLASLTACFGPIASPPPPTAPGLYNVIGWAGQGCFNMSGGGSTQGTCNGVDLYGDVGHPMGVSGPTARCVPSQQWSGNASIDSGALPPGLSFDNSDNVTGIPTSGGHWIVEMTMGAMSCGGTSYIGFKQELRFHIGGGGKVVE